MQKKIHRYYACVYCKEICIKSKTKKKKNTVLTAYVLIF